jgi:hypothetical protein
MSGMFGDFREFYWTHREAFRMAAAGLVFVSAQLVILLWTLRRLQELSNIRERMSRLADGLALLTDTTEAGFASIIHEIQAGQKAKAARAPRATVSKRVVTAARNGEGLARIAENEALSEGEVRLHLAMSDRVKRAPQPAFSAITEMTEPPLAS